MKTAEEILRENFPQCTCDEVYTSRKMTAPDCVYCNWFEQVSDAMREYAAQLQQPQEGLDEMANAYAERVCNGQFPITYTRDQIVKHTAEDYKKGAMDFTEGLRNQVKPLSAIKRGLEKSLDEAYKKLELQQSQEDWRIKAWVGMWRNAVEKSKAYLDCYWAAEGKRLKTMEEQPQEGKALRWVKASERLPPPYMTKFLRTPSEEGYCPLTGYYHLEKQMFYINSAVIDYQPIEAIEWIEEQQNKQHER